jgi:hypothetical protein
MSWPSGLRRNVKAVVFVGVGSNPTDVIAFASPKRWRGDVLRRLGQFESDGGFLHPAQQTECKRRPITQNSLKVTMLSMMRLNQETSSVVTAR